MTEVYLKQIEKLTKLISKPSDWLGITLGIFAVLISSFLNLMPFNWQNIFIGSISGLSLLKTIYKSLYRFRLKKKANKLKEHIHSLSNGQILFMLWEMEIVLFNDKITTAKQFDRKIIRFANEYKKLKLQENSLLFTRNHFRLIEN